MLLNILHRTGFFNLCRTLVKNKKSIAILLHGTYAKTYAHIPKQLHFGMHIHDLEKVIVWLKKENIPLIKTSELLEGKPGLNITLDDGYANNYDYGLHLFEKTETPFTIFVTTRHIIQNGECDILDAFKDTISKNNNIQVPDEIAYELYWGLKPEHVSAMHKHPLVEIGCHTHNHPQLHLCSKQRLNEEIEISSGILERLTQHRPEIFSYPFGDYNQEVINAVVAKRFKAAFAVKPSLRKNKMFEIPRIGIYSSSPQYLSAKLSYLYHTIS